MQKGVIFSLKKEREITNTGMCVFQYQFKTTVWPYIQIFAFLNEKQEKHDFQSWIITKVWKLNNFRQNEKY